MSILEMEIRKCFRKVCIRDFGQGYLGYGELLLCWSQFQVMTLAAQKIVAHVKSGQKRLATFTYRFSLNP